MSARHFILLFSVMALAAAAPVAAQTTAAQEADPTHQTGSTTHSVTVLTDVILEDKSQLKELTGNECDVSNDPNTTNPCSLLKLVADNLGAVRTYSANDPIIGARTMANAPAQIPIDAWGYCRYVNNNSTHSLFIPFRSDSEWVSFINQHPTNIELIGCTRPGQFDLPPNFGTNPQTNQCNSKPNSVKVTLPYMPALPQPTKTVTNAFNCVSADGTPFTETATRDFVGMDSSQHEPNSPNITDWVAADPKYIYDGLCGVADARTSGLTTNTSSSVQPATEKLCHVGVASTPEKQTDLNKITSWNWTCSGGNGGGNVASCSTNPNPQCSNVNVVSLPKDVQWTNLGGDRYRLGTIGNNYWDGTCAVYNRRIVFNIKDLRGVKNFKMIWTGWDDWMQISLNNHEIANVPYIHNGLNGVSSCELSTSWAANINPDKYGMQYPVGNSPMNFAVYGTGSSPMTLKDEFGNQIASNGSTPGYVVYDIAPFLVQGDNTIDMSVIVTDGGEGWMDLLIQADSVCKK